MIYFIGNNEKKYYLEFFLVETIVKRYGCEFISNKEELRIYFIENAEVKYHLGFILLKHLIKVTAVNLFKTKRRCGVNLLKMLK